MAITGKQRFVFGGIIAGIVVLLLLGRFFGPGITNGTPAQGGEWGKNPPEYLSKPVLQLYLVNPQQNSCQRVTDRELAQEVLYLVRTYNTEPTPTKETDCGILIVTPENRYPMYITEPPETERGKEFREAWNAAGKTAVPVVDAYQLLAGFQIERVEFRGFYAAKEQGKAVLLDTSDQQAIAAVLDVLQKVEADSLTVYPPGEVVPVPGADKGSDSYTLVLHLGEDYKQTSIQVDGFQYAFRVVLGFQSKQRLYTCSFETSALLMKGMEQVPGTVVQDIPLSELPVMDGEPLPPPPVAKEEIQFPQPGVIPMLPEASKDETSAPESSGEEPITPQEDSSTGSRPFIDFRPYPKESSQ